MEVGGYEGPLYTELLAGVTTDSGDTQPLLRPEREVLVPVKGVCRGMTEIKVFVQGTPGDTPIITCHDIGLEHRSCFGSFLENAESEPLVRKCCFYHIDFPGQSLGDNSLDHPFPSLDQLSDCIAIVARHFDLEAVFAIGAGAGAYVLARYIMRKEVADPAIRGLIAITPNLRAATWREWSFAKIAQLQLATAQKGYIPAFVVNQLLAGWFGPETLSKFAGLVEEYTRHLTSINTSNYIAFLKVWTARQDLKLALRKKPIAVPILSFSGGNSLRNDQIHRLAGSEGFFSSKRSSHTEMWRAADMVHIEAPDDVATACKLFLRGFSIMV